MSQPDSTLLDDLRRHEKAPEREGWEMWQGQCIQCGSVDKPVLWPCDASRALVALDAAARTLPNPMQPRRLLMTGTSDPLDALSALAGAAIETKAISDADQPRAQGPGFARRHLDMLDARAAFEEAFTPDVALALIARVRKAEAALSEMEAVAIHFHEALELIALPDGPSDAPMVVRRRNVARLALDSAPVLAALKGDSE